MLLPRPSAEIGDTDEFDPRTELVQKLLEYRQMKECAGKLGELADERARLFQKASLNRSTRLLSISLMKRFTVLRSITS